MVKTLPDKNYIVTAVSVEQWSGWSANIISTVQTSNRINLLLSSQRLSTFRDFLDGGRKCPTSQLVLNFLICIYTMDSSDILKKLSDGDITNIASELKVAFIT